MLLTWLACLAGAYFIGSTPVGVLLGRAKGIDIRDHGSRNIGATNVWRVLGRWFGILCFAIDVLKGVAPVVAGGILLGVFAVDLDVLTQPDMWRWIAIAAATVLGHMFSIFLRFGGGKGVATGFGALLGMWSLLTFPALLALVVWYTALRMSRYVSIASICAAVSLPLWSVLKAVPPTAQDIPLSETWQAVAHGAPLHVTLLILAFVIIWKHRTNIARIRRGEEPKAGGTSRRGSLAHHADQRDTRSPDDTG